MKKHIVDALRTFLIGSVVLGLILFLSAWTLNYWQAWVFILVFVGSTNAIGLYLSIKDPALLERRKKVGPTAEKNPLQRTIISFAFIAIFGLLVFCGLDHRFKWTQAPIGISIAGNILIALGLWIDLLVFKENTFGGSTVESYDSQQVISTGPYALVRHPMYVGVLIMMAGVPLALGSWGGLAILAIVLPGLVWRILDEEKLLKAELPGYSDYAQKVRYRLVPYLW